MKKRLVICIIVICWIRLSGVYFIVILSILSIITPRSMNEIYTQNLKLGYFYLFICTNMMYWVRLDGRVILLFFLGVAIYPFIVS